MKTIVLCFALMSASCAAFYKSLADCTPAALAFTENAVRTGGVGWSDALRLGVDCIPRVIANVTADQSLKNHSAEEFVRIEERLRVAQDTYQSYKEGKWKPNR